MKRQRPLWVLLIMLAYGCVATQAGVRVTMEKDAALKHYRVFEVLPVQNETGKTFGVLDVEGILTEQLISKLRAKGYTVNSEGMEPEQDVLLFKSSLVRYERGVTAECIVRTRMTDKRTEKLLGELITGRSVKGAGWFLLPGPLGTGAILVQNERILDMVTTGVADELEIILQAEQSKLRAADGTK